MYIDTHTHVFCEEFDEDRDTVVQEAIKAGVTKLILPAIDSESHNRMENMLDNYSGICLGAIGVHPTSVNDNADYKKELEIVKQKLEENADRYCAVGEIGLDLYWSKEFIDTQIEVLRFQLELSLEYNLPVILHVRDAFSEIFEVLKDYKGLKGVFHGFSGTYEDYLTAKSLGGFKFGIGGVVTFKNSTLPKVVEKMPLEDIVLETDAPYLTPAPHRGKRNNPIYVPIIAQKIADLKCVSLEVVGKTTTDSAAQLFGFSTNSCS
ncbi:MAG: TatD family hydrolase [Rikenellaceae bacterium]